MYGYGVTHYTNHTLISLTTVVKMKNPLGIEFFVAARGKTIKLALDALLGEKVPQVHSPISLVSAVPSRPNLGIRSPNLMFVIHLSRYHQSHSSA
jgi:hypothetical protein